MFMATCCVQARSKLASCKGQIECVRLLKGDIFRHAAATREQFGGLDKGATEVDAGDTTAISGGEKP